MEIFTEEFLKSLADWQRGWGIDQNIKSTLATKLVAECQKIPEKYKKVNAPCFRKRFLHKGELIEIIMADEKKEVASSWTTKKEFAEMFRDLCAPGAVSGAIFEHTPEDSEVILNVCALWSDADFVAAAEAYKVKDSYNAKSLFHFNVSQGEIILDASLKGSEIIALTGASSPFDDLCDLIGIPESQRKQICINLINSGTYPGELQYTSRESAKKVIANVIKLMNDKMNSIFQQGQSV